MIFRLLHTYHMRRKLAAILRHNDVLPQKKFSPEESAILIELFYEKVYALGFPTKRDAVIVDIGAHRGIFAMWAYQMLGPDISLFCFEPETENFSELKKNLSGFNSICKKCGVAAESGTRLLSLSKSVNHTIVSADGASETESVSIEVLSLEDILDEVGHEVDFCKIDCEGAEYETLRSCPVKKIRRVKVFAVEAHWVREGEESINSLIEFFTMCGYSLLGTEITATELPIIEGIATFVRTSRGVE